MTSRRESVGVVAVIAVGAAVALFAGNRPQVAAGVPGLEVSGTSSAVPALSLVALAGAGALVLTRRWARAVIGLVIAIAGVGIVAEGLAPEEFGWFAYSDGTPAFHRSGWAWLTVAGGFAVTAGGLVATWRGRAWPASRRRYEPTSAPLRGGARETWDALDRGEDPTA